ncbi:MAG: SoxR reducing system RseC family protein [Spirochaetia bacterium]
MIEEQAIVQHTDDRHVVFQIVRTGACDVCSIREQCYRNDGVVSVPRSHVHGADARGLDATDSVNLRIRNTSVLGLTGIVYGIPLVAFFAGLLLGHFVLFAGAGPTLQPLGAFASAMAGLGAAGWGIKRYDRRVSGSVRYEVDRRRGGRSVAGAADGLNSELSGSGGLSGLSTSGSTDHEK